MKNRRDLIRAFRGARISRREFVERAAEGTLGLTATLSLLSATAHPQSHPPASAHPPGPAQDHSHADQPAPAYDYNQTNLNPFNEWLKTEGVPVYRDYAVADLRALELKP